MSDDLILHNLPFVYTLAYHRLTAHLCSDISYFRHQHCIATPGNFLGDCMHGPLKLANYNYIVKSVLYQKLARLLCFVYICMCLFLW